MTTPFNTFKSIISISLVFISCYSANLPRLHAQSTAPLKSEPIKILFIGDSFTHGKYPPVLNYNKNKVTDLNYNLSLSDPRFERRLSEPGPWGGIPGLFLKMTEEAGLHYEVSLEAISAKSLTYHREVAKELIFKTKWDVVVLQEISKDPLPPLRGGNQEKFFNSVKELSAEFRKYNPNAKIYLYQTWAIAEEIYIPNSPYYGVPNALNVMTRDLYKAYSFAANSCCTIIPVGNAWLEAIRLNIATCNPYNLLSSDQINLWGKDSRHPSVYGSYLSALVIFATITGLDPTKLHFETVAKELGLSSKAANTLEQIAYTVTRKAKPSKAELEDCSNSFAKLLNWLRIPNKCSPK